MVTLAEKTNPADFKSDWIFAGLQLRVQIRNLDDNQNSVELYCL
jgi:hypothetical protein